MAQELLYGSRQAIVHATNEKYLFDPIYGKQLSMIANVVQMFFFV